MEEYDKHGRMKYDPEYHDNQGEIWSDEDLIYLCSVHEFVERKELAMALGRTETTVSTKLYKLRSKHKEQYMRYRKLGKLI